MRIAIVSTGSIESNALEDLVHLLWGRFNADVEAGSNIPVEVFSADALNNSISRQVC